MLSQILPTLPTLPDLIVSDCNHRIISSLSSFSLLSSLLVKNLGLRTSFFGLNRLSSLKKLILFNIRVIDAPYIHMREFPVLQHLGILHCDQPKDIILHDFIRLQKLHIVDCGNLTRVLFVPEVTTLFELVVEDCPKLKFSSISICSLYFPKKLITRGSNKFIMDTEDLKEKQLDYKNAVFSASSESKRDSLHISMLKDTGRKLSAADEGEDLFLISHWVSDDDSSTTTEDRFRPFIEWQKGELLGHGSLGSVYEGITGDGFFFAIKEVSLFDKGDEGREHIAQLTQEIALLSQFAHENIVQYLGSEMDESHLYIFLKVVTKGSLMSLCQKFTLRDSQVSSFTRQILHGLKYLHDMNVVHRNIKCANILISTNGLAKLADFGLAKATKFNDVNSVKGSVFWMAPEVVRSQRYGFAADIWSLGCTILEMLTGSFPYSNLEVMQALFRIGRGEKPHIPASISSNARDFILECLQVEPSLRPAAAELLEHPFVNQP